MNSHFHNSREDFLQAKRSLQELMDRFTLEKGRVITVCLQPAMNSLRECYNDKVYRMLTMYQSSPQAFCTDTLIQFSDYPVTTISLICSLQWNPRHREAQSLAQSMEPGNQRRSVSHSDAFFPWQHTDSEFHKKVSGCPLSGCEYFLWAPSSWLLPPGEWRYIGGGQEAESKPASEHTALNVQPAGKCRRGPKSQAVAGGTGTGSSEPVAETQPGRFDAVGALPWRGLQVGVRVRLGWGPQCPRLAWMIRISDWGVLSWIL